jgi:hypothetical protein
MNTNCSPSVLMYRGKWMRKLVSGSSHSVFHRGGKIHWLFSQMCHLFSPVRDMGLLCRSVKVASGHLEFLGQPT